MKAQVGPNPPQQPRNLDVLITVQSHILIKTGSSISRRTGASPLETRRKISRLCYTKRLARKWQANWGKKSVALPRHKHHIQ